MASERIQRRIERLLDQADAAADEGDWEEASSLAQRVLAIEPDNADAAALVAMASPTNAPDTSQAFVAEHLADEVRESRERLIGERRTVTVLYVDAVGFTALAETLDEEQVYGIAQSCVAVMTECVHDHDGTVTQFRGDGIMALFGAPLAQEDAAVKAARAALQMRDRLAAQRDALHSRHEADCQFRIGLHTGPVVVGSISDDLQMDFTAIGDTVNLAARLEEAAGPGTVWCSAETAAAVDGYVIAEPRGLVSVKGKTEPIETFELVALSGAQSRLEAALARGLSGFVGRERELGLLGTYLERRSTTQPTCVTVVGEAGAGKSRLVLEARARADDDARWVRGQCVSAGAEASLLPLRLLVRDWLGVTDAMDEAGIRTAFEQATGGWPATVAPYLAFLLDLEVPELASVDGRVLQAGVTDALTALISSRDGTPTVVVIEDVHWIDPVSATVLRRLVETARVGFLLVLTERPGYDHPLEGWSALGRLVLQQLDAADAGMLAAESAGAEALSPDAAAAIATRAGGNPLFLEELTRSFVEEGLIDTVSGDLAEGLRASDLPAPASVQDVILARIDRLGDEAKAALQIASVIGREFSVLLLDHLARNPRLDVSLELLRTVELIRLASESPELAFMFKHALTHDVAYRTLLLERRRVLHLEAARAIEEIYADRIAEFHTELARHYVISERWTEAIPHLEESITRAIQTGAIDAALRFSDQLLDVSRKIDDTSVEASALRMKALTYMRAFGARGQQPARRAAETYAELTALLERTGDHEAAVQTSTLSTWSLITGHRPEQADDVTIAAVQEAERLGVPDLLALAGAARAFVNACIHGDLNAAQDAKDRVRPEVPTAPDVQGLGHLTDILLGTWRGDYRQGIAAAEALVPLLEDPFAPADSAAGPRWLQVLNLCGAGQYEKALAKALALDDYYARLGEVEFRSRLLNSIGWLFYEILDFDSAEPWNQRSIELISTFDEPDNEPLCNSWLNLADLRLETGRKDEARDLLDRVAEIVVNPKPEDFMVWRYSMHWTNGMVRLALLEDDPTAALGHADDLVSRAVSAGAGRHEAIGRRLRAEALLELARVDEARTELTNCLEVADRVGNPTQRWRAHLLGRQIATATGDTESAADHLASAGAIITDVAEGLAPKRREKFVAAPVTAEALAPR